MKQLFALACTLLVASASAHGQAQTAAREPIDGKESWVYRQTARIPGKAPQTIESRYTLMRLTNGDVLSLRAALVQPGQQVGWQRLGTLERLPCLYDFLMQGTVGVDDTCHASLDTGERWHEEYARAARQENVTYVVMGTEAVEVPAGRFDAIKIEGDRVSTELLPPDASPSRKPGIVHYRLQYWFVPRLKTMARGQFDAWTDDNRPLMSMTHELLPDPAAKQ